VLKARIRNVLGVENAEFELKGITLVSGRNGEGKSSLLQAVAAVALADPSIRSLAQKAQRGQAVREGADLGVALLDWGTGSQRVVWPTGTVESTGQPFAGGFGSPLGIGAREWSSQESKTRATEFALRAKATPTVDDIRAFLKAQDGNPDQAEALWSRIDVSGWDSVLKAAQEAATKLKGAWENVAGVAFGPLKSKNWRPAILRMKHTPSKPSPRIWTRRARRVRGWLPPALWKPTSYRC
jgi:energy-coupling factor transporter ATP-binding protein EcfA2